MSTAQRTSETETSPDGLTILLRGRTYRVVRSESVDRETGEVTRDYTLYGKRGARYRTVRNVPTPHMMFLVDDRRFGVSSVMDGVWLSDEHRVLRIVCG